MYDRIQRLSNLRFSLQNKFRIKEKMIRALNNQNDRQFAPKSAQQMFRRIDKINSQQSRISRTSKQSRNFPSLNQTSMKKFFQPGKSLDNSKQNLMYQNYLQKVNSASKIDQKSIVSNYLNLLRKDYDKMHKQTKQHMSSINLKKKDIDFIKQRVKVQQQSVENLQKRNLKGIQELTKIYQKQQEVQTQRNTLDHIIFRIKKDQIFYKQYGRVYEGHLNQKRKVLKALKQNILYEDQKIHKLVMSMEDMKMEFQKNQEFRSRKLEDYCEKLQNIHEKQIFIQERKERTMQLQSIESNDILKAKNIEMRNICLINKVADCLFQSKLQNLMQTYSSIQNAFHTIQVKTSISDPSLLANKFFSYEELTQNLLKSITQYEKELSEKTKRNEQLKQQFKKLQQKTYSSDCMEVQHKKANRLTADQVRDINQKHLQYQRITQWIDRQAKRLKILTNETENQNIEEIIKKFSQVCMKTKTQTHQMAKTLKTHEKFVTPGIRIKKIVKQSNFDLRNQKMKQSQQARESNMSQDQYLKVARAGVKRNFLIKQKTINMGNLCIISQVNNQGVISDRKMRSSDNR